MRVLIAVSAALFATAAPAQAPAWQVPVRGAVVYTRTTDQFEVTQPPSGALLEWRLAPGEDGGSAWHYLATTDKDTPGGWQEPRFDDGAWLVGNGEFGPDGATQAQQHTYWGSQVLLLRTHVDLGKKRPKALLFRCNHDDGITIHWNGKQVVDDKGFGRNRMFVVGGDDLAAFAAGDNLLAVRCINTGGAQYLDVALALVPTLPPGAKTIDDLKTIFGGATAARVRADLFGGFRPPAIVLHGELDAAQQRTTIVPSDLREVGFWVASDLQKATAQGGSYQTLVPRMYRLGDLQLKVRAGPLGADGWQDLDVALATTAEPAPGADRKRFVTMFVTKHVLYGFDGQLHVRRRIAAVGDKLRVAECTCTTTGRFLRGKDWREHAADLRLRESFAFAAERENQDPAFRAMVGKSLERGVAHLQKSLADLTVADLAATGEAKDRSYHSGRLALALLALLKAGVPHDDPVVANGLAELRTRPLVDTYSLGNALMALDAYYTPATEYADLKEGRLERQQQHEVPASDRALMRRWTDQLLSNADTRVDRDYLLRFSYIGEARYDHSVNQYGLLGLYAAHLCGIDIEPKLWEAAIAHLVAAQGDPGPPLALEIVDLRTLARMASEPDLRRTASQFPVRIAGWHYDDPKEGGMDRPVWGSMTCAGITGLAVSEAALRDLGSKRLKLLNEAAAARNAAFGWLALNFTARYHPGEIAHQQHWFYYYIYSLERAALLSNVAWVQGRDWYFEIAMVLGLAQNDDGGWPGELHYDDSAIERTAMALLFLKRGTAPVLTGK